MDFLANYGLFFAKVLTVVIAILVVIVVAAGMRMRDKTRTGEGHIEVRHWNNKLRKLKEALQGEVLDKSALKQLAKEEKQLAKQEAKEQKRKAKESGEDDKAAYSGQQRVFVLNFHGDIRAQTVEAMREEVTTVLTMATDKDEVVVKVESGGGMVHAYGLAASQLQRVRDKGLTLTVCVDKVAASGGYMMAVVANKIIAAPFAVLGSIGVLVQIPNFHRLLKKHDIDYEMLTAGEYKRTLTVFGENTDKGREKFQEDLEDTHVLFKEFVAEQRPQLDIEKVATGEVWFGKRALERGLVDELQTSDAYLVARCESAEVYEVKYVEKKPLQERIGITFQSVLDDFVYKWLGRLTRRDSSFF